MKFKNKIISTILTIVLAVQGVCCITPTSSANDEITSSEATASSNKAKENVPVFDEDGNTVKSITLNKGETETINVKEGKDTDYQWQILLDEESNSWVNILDQNQKDLYVSGALLNNAENDSAKLRCVLNNGKKEIYSTGVTVNLEDSSDNSQASSQEDEDEETVTITINYFYEYDTSLQVQNPYVATIERGSAFNETVISPIALGFKPYYKQDAPNNTDPSLAEDKADSITPVFESLTEDVVYNVYYKSSDVDYKIAYLFQNVNDDRYTEDVKRRVSAADKTGKIITEDIINENAGDTTGFTYLYCYPVEVAADGSTVINCYYDRKYYLMNFNLNGGFGTDPIYARYGSSFVVNTPSRAGYDFVGWDFISYEVESDVIGEPPTVIYEKDGVEGDDGLPDELPKNITRKETYKALWTPQEVSFNVVYWKENANDNKYSYWGIDTAPTALSGSTVNGKDYKALPQSILDASTDWDQFLYSHADTNIVIKGDGSSVANVYYRRKLHTLTFSFLSSSASLSGLHTHTAACKELVCGISDNETHTHTGLCNRNESSKTDDIACIIPEHVHSPNCYGIKSLSPLAINTYNGSADEKTMLSARASTFATFDWWNELNAVSEGTLRCYRYDDSATSKAYYFYILTGGKWHFITKFVGDNPEGQNLNGYKFVYKAPTANDTSCDYKLNPDLECCTKKAHTHDNVSCMIIQNICCSNKYNNHKHTASCCTLHQHTYSCYGLYDPSALPSDEATRKSVIYQKYSHYYKMLANYTADLKNGTLITYHYSTNLYFHYVYINNKMEFLVTSTTLKTTKVKATSSYTYNPTSLGVGSFLYFKPSDEICSDKTSEHIHDTGMCNYGCNKIVHTHTEGCATCNNRSHTEHAITCYGFTTTFNVASSTSIAYNSYLKYIDIDNERLLCLRYLNNDTIKYYFYFKMGDKWYFAGSPSDIDDNTTCYGIKYTGGKPAANGMYTSMELKPSSCNLHHHGEGNCQYIKCYSNETEHNINCFYRCGKHEHSDACYRYTCGKVETKYSTYNLYGSYRTLTVTAKYGQDISKVWDLPLIKKTIKDDNNTGSVFRNTDYKYFDYFTQYMGNRDIVYNAESIGTIQYTYNTHYYLEVPQSVTADSIVTGEGDGKGTLGNTYYEYHTTIFGYDSGGMKLTYDEDYFPIKGYKRLITEEDFMNNDNPYRHYTADLDNNKNLQISLFYDLDEYNIDFINADGIPVGEAQTYDYLANLPDFNTTLIPPYPTSLPEGCYEFAGWYTTAKYIPGTEFGSDEIMPAENLALYAKWIPKKYDVKFFLTESRMKEYNDTDTSQENSDLLYLTRQAFYNETVTEAVPTPNHPDYAASAGMEFVSWFFYDEIDNSKKSYVPEEHRVTGDLKVFAEWKSTSIQPYRIEYVLRDDHSVTVAEPTHGIGFLGTTRTFNAKKGAPYTELYDEYLSGYYPTFSSHSMVIKEEAVGAAPETATENVFQFEYVHKPSVNYTIEYINKETGEVLATSEEFNTSDSVVTERYKVIEGYLPDMSYKRFILTADDNKNIITFYYTANTTKSYYTIHHMLQKPGSSENPVYTENDTSYLDGIASIGDDVTITPDDFTGYTRVEEADCKIGENTSQVNPVGGTYTVTVDENGTDVYIYYNLNKYPYVVRYLDYNDPINNVEANRKYTYTIKPFIWVNGNKIYGSEFEFDFKNDMFSEIFVN